VHVAQQSTVPGYPAAPRGPLWAKESCGANNFLAGVIFKIIFKKVKIKKNPYHRGQSLFCHVTPGGIVRGCRPGAEPPYQQGGATNAFFSS
jgi:hypothetical protein